jgi:hypothetical protein
VRTIHHGYTPEIEVLDGRLAADVWAMMDEIRDRSLRLVLRGWSRYHETYEPWRRGPVDQGSTHRVPAGAVWGD